MVAFAELSDLEDLTGRDFTGREVQVGALLEAASEHLREVIGQQVFPVTQSTYVAYPSGGREDLPQWPVVSVDAVQRDGVDVEFTYRPGYITVADDEPVEVTFTWGVTSAPGELKTLTCVLVSQVLTTVEMNLGLSVGGLSSIAIDDFRAAFADGGASAGMTLTPHAEAVVRRRFGRGDVQVVETGR